MTRFATLLTHLILLAAQSFAASSTINSGNRFAYGANIGWMDWRAGGGNGVVIGEHVCSGFIYSANVGWIHLGSGTPANGIRYQNNSASDYGVNHDGFGNLRGYAWGANIGWINFENIGAPRLDVFTGKLSGNVWGANIGWISLSNAMAQVQTDSIDAGTDADGDGIPDAFERIHAVNLSMMNATSDLDGDTFSDLSEYLAGTNPADASSNLRITSFTRHPSGTAFTITWSSVSNRGYVIETRDALGTAIPWSAHPLGNIQPDAGTTTTRTAADSPAGQRYIRLRAIRPPL